MLQVFWISDRGGKLAAEGATYRTSQNGTLHFPAVDKEDEGRYKCRVSNSPPKSNGSKESIVTIGIDLSIYRRLCLATEKRCMFFSSLLTGWFEVIVTVKMRFA
jgi:hypothetical protein